MVLFEELLFGGLCLLTFQKYGGDLGYYRKIPFLDTRGYIVLDVSSYLPMQTRLWLGLWLGSGLGFLPTVWFP